MTLTTPKLTTAEAPFVRRHNGPSPQQEKEMLDALGVRDLPELMKSIVPADILAQADPELPEPLTETQCLTELARMAGSNQVWRTFLGLGYQAAVMPPVLSLIHI